MASQMDSPTTIPTEVHDAAAVSQIQAAAVQHHSPCGDGNIVWHQWGAGEPVVLLHGGSGSWTHWVRNIGALVQAGYQVLAPDLPGFGDSAKAPDGNDADVMPRWLETGLQQILGATPCHLVGFSFGAMVGTLLTAACPQRVSNLVLIGAPALEPAPRSMLDLRAWDHLPAGPERDAIHRHNLAALMLARPESIDDFAVRLHADNLVRDRLRKRRLAWTDIVVRTLRQVTCPVHGIWGAEDAVYRNRVAVIEPALAQAADFRGLQMLPATGHWAQYEAAPAFNTALLQTLNAAHPGKS